MQSDSVELMLNLYAQAPEDITLLSPAEGETNISITPELSWSDNPDAESYELDLALDATFTDIFTAIQGPGRKQLSAGNLPAGQYNNFLAGERK